MKLVFSLCCSNHNCRTEEQFDLLYTIVNFFFFFFFLFCCQTVLTKGERRDQDLQGLRLSKPPRGRSHVWHLRRRDRRRERLKVWERAMAALALQEPPPSARVGVPTETNKTCPDCDLISNETFIWVFLLLYYFVRTAVLYRGHFDFRFSFLKLSIQVYMSLSSQIN